jgi:hypothetical protein
MLYQLSYVRVPPIVAPALIGEPLVFSLLWMPTPSRSASSAA